MNPRADHHHVATKSRPALTVHPFKWAILALVILMSTASAAQATSFTFTTDGTWLAKNAAPGAGWESNPAFNTVADGGWVNAFVWLPNCSGQMDCIWYDGQFSTTEQAYFRYTFFLDGPATSGILFGGVDDDARIWINGTIVYDVFNGLAENFGPINIAPYLVPGNNLIAVFADDNLFFGFNHGLATQMDIQTAAAVPEPGTVVLLTSGLALLVARKVRRRRLS